MTNNMFGEYQFPFKLKGCAIDRNLTLTSKDDFEICYFETDDGIMDDIAQYILEAINNYEKLKEENDRLNTFNRVFL